MLRIPGILMQRLFCAIIFADCQGFGNRVSGLLEKCFQPLHVVTKSYLLKDGNGDSCWARLLSRISRHINIYLAWARKANRRFFYFFQAHNCRRFGFRLRRNLPVTFDALYYRPFDLWLAPWSSFRRYWPWEAHHHRETRASSTNPHFIDPSMTSKPLYLFLVPSGIKIPIGIMTLAFAAAFVIFYFFLGFDGGLYWFLFCLMYMLILMPGLVFYALREPVLTRAARTCPRFWQDVHGGGVAALQTPVPHQRRFPPEGLRRVFAFYCCLLYPRYGLRQPISWYGPNSRQEIFLRAAMAELFSYGKHGADLEDSRSFYVFYLYHVWSSYLFLLIFLAFEVFFQSGAVVDAPNTPLNIMSNNSWVNISIGSWVSGDEGASSSLLSAEAKVMAGVLIWIWAIVCFFFLFSERARLLRQQKRRRRLDPVLKEGLLTRIISPYVFPNIDRVYLEETILSKNMKEGSWFQFVFLGLLFAYLATVGLL